MTRISRTVYESPKAIIQSVVDAIDEAFPVEHPKSEALLFEDNVFAEQYQRTGARNFWRKVEHGTRLNKLRRFPAPPQEVLATL